MPADPSDVTPDDLLEASYRLGAPIVTMAAVTDADLPRLIGMVMAAVDELQMHKGLVSTDAVEGIVRGWLDKAGAQAHPTQALGVAAIRAAATAHLLRRFTAEGALHRAARSSAAATATLLGVATDIALARQGGGGRDDASLRAALKGARRDLRDAVQAYETLRKEMAAMGFTL